jgi:hypothetical protein
MKYFEEKCVPFLNKANFIYSMSLCNNTITIMPKGWQGGSVSINTNEIDMLIEELQQAKRITNGK